MDCLYVQKRSNFLGGTDCSVVSLINEARVAFVKRTPLFPILLFVLLPYSPTSQVFLVDLVLNMMNTCSLSSSTGNDFVRG